MYQQDICLKGSIHMMSVSLLSRLWFLQVATDLHRTAFRQNLSVINWNDMELYSAGQAIFSTQNSISNWKEGENEHFAYVHTHNQQFIMISSITKEAGSKIDPGGNYSSNFGLLSPNLSSWMPICFYKE